MTELVDYSGNFDPKFTHHQFTKKTLVNLLETYSEYIRQIGSLWYIGVSDRWGNDAAFDCEASIWEPALLYELRVISSLLGIQGDDAATVMQFLQVSQWAWGTKYEIDTMDKDHAIITFYTCPALYAIEKEGMGREKSVCNELEPRAFATVAHFFNPNIKIAALKLPPRASYSDPCCQWEFQQVPTKAYDGKLPALREEQLNRLIEISPEIHELAVGTATGACGGADALEERRAERRALLDKLKWRSARSAP